jgi:hypothetical protein
MIKNLRPKLCEQGKIKIGVLGEPRTSTTSGKAFRLPTKLNHFIVTTTERDKTGNFVPNVPLMEEIARIVDEPADHLTTIPVYLLFDDIDSNFYTSYNCYEGRTRICTGDGEKATLLKTGEEVPCPCPKLDRSYKGPTPCKPYGRLTVVLQTMDIIGGSWVYRTTGWNSVSDLLGSILLIKRLAGRLTGIPLRLKIFPKTVQLPTGNCTIYTVSLIYQGSTKTLIDEARQYQAITHEEYIAPDQTIRPDEEVEIQEEFFPSEEPAAEKLQLQPVKKVKKPGRPPKAKDKVEEPTAAELAQVNEEQKEQPLPEQEQVDESSTAPPQFAEFQKSPIDIAMESAKKEKTAAMAKKKSPEPPVEEEEEELSSEESTEDDFGWV